MHALSRFRRRDPFWDYDGKSARRQRSKQRVVRFLLAVLAIVFLAVVATNLPEVDQEFILTGPGRPILIGSLMVLLAACVLAGLARLRHTPD